MQKTTFTNFNIIPIISLSNNIIITIVSKSSNKYKVPISYKIADQGIFKIILLYLHYISTRCTTFYIM